ncbi:MAG: diguanylate cyclase [Desulfotomaculum sp.]|nr:diguanylate cyclase [Desulfotomaculum sp.]
MKEKIMQEILRQAPFGYAYHKILLNERSEPEDYIFLDINPAFEEMTGLKKEAILGKRVTEVLSGIRSSSFDWVDFYGKVALTGERKEFTRYAEPLGRWYKITAFAPQKGYFTTIFQEITSEIERVKTLEAQKKQIGELATELEIVFNATQDAMFLVRVENGELRYMRNNAAHQKLTGFSLEDIKDKTPVELAGKEIGEAVNTNYQRCLKIKKHMTYEETLTLSAGKRTWLTTLTPVLEKGKVKYLVGSSKDITLQKQAEEELKKRLGYEKLISSVSYLALQERSLEVFLTKSLHLLGEGIEVSRVYLFEADWVKETVSNTFEWTAPGITPQKENLQEIPVAEFTWWVDRLKNREVINYKDIEDIPDEKTKEILRSQEIKSLLVLPVYLEGDLYGFIGFDDCLKNREWSEADINLLQLTARIISEYILRKKFEEKVIFLSYHDHLTGLYNRRFVEKEIKRLDTPRQLPLSFIMGDINGLKLTNDVFGHEAGDKLLKKAAEVIKKSCRKEDIIVRWGGDEFLILLPRTTAKSAEEIMKRIKNRCLQVKGVKAQLSIAMGYAVKAQASENLWQVIKEAEEWMNRRKLMEGKSYRNAIINTLLATLYAKSTETKEHAERLKNYCLMVGRRMRLSVKELDELALLAVLHDIGKVGIKESVLQKSGPLSSAEWEEMKKHPEIGYRIAQNTPELASIAEYILCHHERWDGHGYPRGLKGEEIPLLCRILAVADAYDAMTSDRSYRKAMSRDEAIAEIKRNMGKQFDPVVAEIFLRIMVQEHNMPKRESGGI